MIGPNSLVARFTVSVSFVAALTTACASSSSRDNPAVDDGAMTAAPAAAPARGATVPVVSKGSADGHLTVLDLPAKTIEGLLPPELELAPGQDLSPAGMHPLVVGTWKHSGVAGVAPGSPPPVAYSELAVLIPYVQFKSGVDCVEHVQGPFGYMPYLALDNQQAIDVGVNFYGYAKHLATVEASDTSFTVKSADGANVLASATFGPSAAPTPAMGAPIATLEHALSVPLLGKLASGAIVWSYFDWQFPTASISTSKINVGFTAASPILAGASLQASNSIPGIAMHMDWQLSAPVSCANGGQ